MLIKILGTGCARCKEAESIVTAAVRDTGSSAAVEKVTDLKTMMALGVMSTPAVVIDNKVMCTGRVPSKAEVIGWIATPDTHASANSACTDSCGGTS